MSFKRVAEELVLTDALTPNHDGTPEHYIVDAENIEYLIETVAVLIGECL